MVRSVAGRLIRTLKRRLGLGYFPPIDEPRRTVRLGSGYGGWEVDIGLLDQGSIVYSVGVGEDISFDLALIGATGVRVHAFDPTPRSIAWVRRQGTPPEFELHEVGLADRDAEVEFHAPEDPGHVSHSLVASRGGGGSIRVPVRRLKTIMADLGHGSLDLLKIDIEGAEYGVVDDICRSGIRPRQLLIEFHHRFPEFGTARTEAAIKSLKDAGYRLFWVSDLGEEFGFVHRSE